MDIWKDLKLEAANPVSKDWYVENIQHNNIGWQWFTVNFDPIWFRLYLRSVLIIKTFKLVDFTFTSIYNCQGFLQLVSEK